ncbi:MAG: AraC family transcriptional regulator [Clostridiales bacterium]|nr:AraC family transcriptional regulator [Clostridiales bacterium]
MDAFAQLNMAMQYIEEHLMEEIDAQELSRIAYCSEYHFRRMFSFLAGMPLGEYIRRRRLALAATVLKNSKEKIIDLTLRMGYNSPDAFAKAFQNMHGVSPSQARKNNVALKAFPPMTFRLIIQGGTEMNYRIVEKEAFFIAGIKKRIPLIYEGKNPHMDSMWASLTIDDFTELKQLSNVEPTGILCVSANFTEGRFLAEGDYVDEYIGVATTKVAPNRWEILSIDACTWAAFTTVGEFPKTLQDTWARIFTEWFPTSGYESTGGPEILWNESPNTTKPDYKSELWIPITKGSQI